MAPKLKDPCIQKKPTLVSHCQGPSASRPTWDLEAKIPRLLGQWPSRAGPAERDNLAGGSLCSAVRAFRTGGLSPVHLGDSGGKCREAGPLTKTGPLRGEIKPGAQGTESVVKRGSTRQREHRSLPGHRLVLAVIHPGAKLYLAHIIEATRQTLAAACETPSENINM